MPKVLLPLPDVDTTVLRPVVTEVLQDVLRLTKLEPGARIIYPGDAGQAQQPGSALEGAAQFNQFDNNPHVYIQVSETVLEDHLLNGSALRFGNQHVFLDDALDIYLRPGYTFTEATISVNYRATDRVKALSWRDGIQARIAAGMEALQHEASYSYLLPPEILVILQELHRLRENVAGYGETFDTWFTHNGTSRTTRTTNQAGSGLTWTVREKALRIQGRFDFSSAPEKGQYADNQAAWEISFSYVFQYEKPTAAMLGYPIIVHNQLLGTKYRDTSTKLEQTNRPEMYSYSTLAFKHFEAQRAMRRFSYRQGVAIPSVDDFLPASTMFSTLRIFTALIQVTKIDAQGTLLNLGGLGKYVFKERVLEFLAGEAPFMTQPFKSVFQLNLYRRRQLIEATDNPIRVDAALNVVNNTTLDLRVPYRVRLGLVSNLQLLDPEALIRLRENADILELIIQIIDPDYLGPSIPVIGDNYVGKDDLESLLGYLYNRPRSLELQAYRMLTTNLLFVDTTPSYA